MYSKHLIMNFGEDNACITISDLKKIITEIEDQDDTLIHENDLSLKDSIKQKLAQMEQTQQMQELTIKSISESIEQIKKQQDQFSKLMSESLKQLKKNQRLLKKSMNKYNDSPTKDSINKIEQQHGTYRIQLEKLKDQNDQEHFKFISICDDFKNIFNKM